MTYRIDLLARHHQRLLEIIETAYPLITASHADADTVGLRHLRREMEETLMSYERFIREDICERSLWSATDEAVQDARALLASCQLLRKDYRGFIHRWTATESATNWARYRLAIMCMIQQFRDHIIESAIMSKRWLLVGAN